MAIIYTYTKVTPQPIDSMVITDVSDKNFTKTALIGEAVNESIAAGTNICLGWDSSTGITTINSASYSFDSLYEPQYWEVKFNKDLCGTVSTVDTLKFIITPVNGTDVISTGEPLDYDTSNPDVWNLTQFAYGGQGNVGYVPAGGDAGEYLDGGTGLWTTLPADQNTTYDLNSIQNVNDSDIRLVGSDGTTDIVKLVAGTNITLTDTGSNITIEAATGGYSWIAQSGATSYTVANGEEVIFTGTGGITVTPSDAGAGAAPYTFTIDGSSISPGTVTEVDATIGAGISPSGITLATTPATGIVATGSVDIQWSGSIGDLLYGADDGAGNAVLTPLPIGTAGHVLTSDGGVVPGWTAPAASGCANAIGQFNVTSGASVTIDSCGETVTFGSSDSTVEISGNNISKTLDLTIKNVPCASSANVGGILVPATPYTGAIESPATGAAYPVEITEDCNAVVRLPDTTSPVTGTFEPLMVSQGFDGTSALVAHPDVVSMAASTGRYRVYGGLAYIEFFVEFTGTTTSYLQETLGIAVAGEGGRVLGLQTLTGLSNLPTNTTMNACVTIADCGFSNVSDITGNVSWRRAVVGGKLNKFYDGSNSVIWLMNGGTITGATTADVGFRGSPTWGVPSNPSSNDYWLQFLTDPGNPYIAGSMTISLT